MKKIILTDHFKQQLDPEFYGDLEDYDVITAYSNENALELHRSQKADLIVTELYGSGMNGGQFCTLLREDEQMRGVSVILYCRDNEVEIEESVRSRANAVLTLPVRRDRLREKIQQLLAIPPRRPFRSDFNARRSGVSAGGAIGCRTENISMTGMLIEAKADLKKGEKLQCTLNLPSLPSFTALAEVIRTGKEKTTAGASLYGVRFSRLDPPARRAIELIVGGSARPNL